MWGAGRVAEGVNLDILAKQADEGHPLTYEIAGIPVTYCIVPRLSVLNAIEELRFWRAGGALGTQPKKG